MKLFFGKNPISQTSVVEPVHPWPRWYHGGPQGEPHRRRELDRQHDVVGRLRALVVDLDQELERAADREQGRGELEARVQKAGRPRRVSLHGEDRVPIQEPALPAVADDAEIEAAGRRPPGALEEDRGRPAASRRRGVPQEIDVQARGNGRRRRCRRAAAPRRPPSAPSRRRPSRGRGRSGRRRPASGRPRTRAPRPPPRRRRPRPPDAARRRAAGAPGSRAEEGGPAGDHPQAVDSTVSDAASGLTGVAYRR